MKIKDSGSCNGKVFDLAVIGGGPGGYVAAIRAAQLGLRTALIEKENIGGVCMNWGCIPTKYLLSQTKLIRDITCNGNLEGPSPRLNWEKVQAEKQSIVGRLVKGIEFLLQRNSVFVYRGEARLPSGDIIILAEGENQKISSAATILATGSRPAELPFLKADGEQVLTSRQALSLRKIPSSLIIIGAGAIGLEMATIFKRMGSEVMILEMMPNVLPGSDREMALRLERVLKKQKIRVLTGMQIEKKCEDNSGIELSGTCLKTGEAFRHNAEKAILAVGRIPCSKFLKDDLPGIKMDRAGFISVDSSMKTSIPGFYAIGDLAGGKLLAHKASHEGVVAAESTSGLDARMEYHAVPAAVFTDPEFASVGMSQEEAEREGTEVKTGVFMLQASGRAVTMGETDGMVKIIADKDERLLGAHILAPHAGDMISELSLAVNKNLHLEDIISTMHIHPTLSECLMEAALAARKQSIHALNG